MRFKHLLIIGLVLSIGFFTSCSFSGNEGLNTLSAKVTSSEPLSVLEEIIHTNPDTAIIQTRSNAISNGIIIDLSSHYGKLSKQNFTYSVNTATLPNGMTSDSFTRTIDAGIILWSSVCSVSFKRVTSGGDFIFEVQHHYAGMDGVGGSAPGIGQTGSVIFYNNKTDIGNMIPINWDANAIYGVTVHEIGHCLGMRDMRNTTHTIPPNGSNYYDQEYFRWRMSFVSGAYDVSKDTHVSIMDYDCASGQWGHSPQCGYLSAYDIAVMQYKYGTPDYVPFITFWCDKGPDGVTDYSCSFTTTDWDVANSMARQFKGGSDVQGLVGVIPRTYKTNAATRHLLDMSVAAPYQKGYYINISTISSPIPTHSYIKYVYKSGGTANMTFGTLSNARTLSPVFEYKYWGRPAYWVTQQEGDPAQYGFEKRETVGYIVLASEMNNP